MDFSLSDEQRILHDQISKFAATELNRTESESASEGEFPHERWQKCGEMLLQGLPVPESLGGAGDLHARWSVTPLAGPTAAGLIGVWSF